MPNYEYECVRCNKRFTDYKPITDCAKDNVCDCGSKATRVMSKVYWKAFLGSCEYDRMNNFPPGTSATDIQKPTEEW
jgi:putative FmdB family regulatory protein